MRVILNKSVVYPETGVFLKELQLLQQSSLFIYLRAYKLFYSTYWKNVKTQMCRVCYQNKTEVWNLTFYKFCLKWADEDCSYQEG